MTRTRKQIAGPSRLKARLLLVGCLCALTIVMAPTLDAQETSETGVSPTPFQATPLSLIVQQMGSPRFQVREFATRALIESSIETAAIREVLEESSLSDEQRHRLVSALRERLINAPRGAVGIRMSYRSNLQGRGGRIIVTDLLEGLPARDVLEIGDAIVHIDGIHPGSTTDLIVHVQTKRPGEAVSMRIERPLTDERKQEILDENLQPQYEVFDVEIVLGSADLLQNRSTTITQSQTNMLDSALIQRVEQQLIELRPRVRVVPIKVNPVPAP